jgi:hypothetical protein
VDAQWSIPHFEKMLYDNALLLDVLAKVHRRYPQPLFAAVIEETVGWLLRDMRHPDGPFSAALDADSPGGEGAAYVWTPAQVRELLGEADARVLCAAYGISEEGNFEHGASQPALVEDDFARRTALAPLREKLLATRQQRPQPARDPKIILAWNALAVRGLAEAAWTLGRRDWFLAARQAADWMWDNLRHDEAPGRPRLRAVAYAIPGEARSEGFLDDYAFLAEALLVLAAYADWVEPGAGATYAARARALVETIRAHFRDAHEAGYFFTADDQEPLAVRKKEWWDNAIPSGHAALAHALVFLHALTGDASYAADLVELKKAYAGLAGRAPTGVAHALTAFTWDALGVAVIKCKGPRDLEALRAALVARPYRPVLLAMTNDSAQPDGFQLCVGTQCAAPTTDLVELAELL